MRIELSDVYHSGRAVLCKQAIKLYFRTTAHEKDVLIIVKKSIFRNQLNSVGIRTRQFDATYISRAAKPYLNLTK